MQAAVLKSARLAAGLTQSQAAERLGVTQALLSMLESGRRAVSPKLASDAVKLFGLPASALLLPHGEPASHDSGWFFDMLGTLGYPPFAHYRLDDSMNPADFLLTALSMKDLDARVVEALPWVPMVYRDLDWEWLAGQAKIRDLQNRLAFTVSMSSSVANLKKDSTLARFLEERVTSLEPSRLVREDTLCHASMGQTERAWTRQNRRDVAKHWNLLSNFKPEFVPYVED